MEDKQSTRQKIVIPYTNCVICGLYIKYETSFQIRIQGYASAKNVGDADPQLNCSVQFAHDECLDDFFTVTYKSFEVVKQHEGA